MNDVTVERSALGALRVVVRWPTQDSPTEVWLTPEQGAELARQLVAAIDEVEPSDGASSRSTCLSSTTSGRSTRATSRAP